MTRNQRIEKYSWLLLGALGIFLLVRPVFQPVFIGLSMACAAWGLRNRLEERFKFKRKNALLIVPIFSLILLIGIISFAVARIIIFIQFIQSELKEENLSQIFSTMERGLQIGWVKHAMQLFGLSDSKIRSLLLDFLTNISFLDPFKYFFGALPSIAVGLVLVAVTFFYVYFYQEKIVAMIRHQDVVSRFKTDQIWEAFSDFSYMTYVSAGFAALIQGTIIMIGGLASGVVQAPFWGLLATIFAFVPYFGTLPVSLLMMGTLYFSNASGTSIFLMLGFAAFASIGDDIVRPYLMKAGGNLHPWLGFISIVGGLQVWGIAGIFIGPVLIGVSMTLIKMYFKMGFGIYEES
jgi:predicted PurR-regulated permease PerM